MLKVWIARAIISVFISCLFLSASLADDLSNNVPTSRSYLVRVKINIPPDYKLNTNAPSSAVIVVQHDGGTVEQKVDIQSIEQDFHLDIPGGGEIGLVSTDLMVFYCRKDKRGQCLFNSLSKSVQEDNQKDLESSFVFDIKLPEGSASSS